MDFSALLYSFGLSGFFTSRAFLPAFATALALRHGDSIPYLRSLDFIQSAAESPSWFTHPAVVWGLGILALAELIGEKSPEIREIMNEGTVYAKTALSAATSFGLLSVGDSKAVEGIISMAGIFDTIPAVFSAIVTFYFSSARSGVMAILTEADDDDTLGIRKFISWCEELWVFLGVWLLLLLPLLVAGLIAIVLGAFWLIQKRHEKKQEFAKIECPACQTRIHPFATACYSCDAAVSSPKKLSFLGKTLQESESDIEAQKLRLIELKRSPKSGEKAEGRGVDVVCKIDGVKPLGDATLTKRYSSMVDSRLPKVMVVGGLISLVPILGLIVGVVYYRFQLVAPYRRYIPLGRGFVVKWLIRLLFVGLVFLQVVPALGAFAVPIMALVNHRFYRSAFHSELKKANLLPT